MDHIQNCAPVPRQGPRRDPFFVYVMGPYTAFDASIPFSNTSSLHSQFITDPLFHPQTHPQKTNRGTYEAALADLCDDLRAQFGVRAFLATDIQTIPTKQAADDSEPGMSVLDQSIAFAASSDAVVFVFTKPAVSTDSLCPLFEQIVVQDTRRTSCTSSSNNIANLIVVSVN